MHGTRETARRCVLLAGLVLSLPSFAQEQRLPLSQVLPDLVLREIVLDSPAGSLFGGGTHLAHFSPLEAGELNNPVVGIVQGFNGQLATQFATFPLGSSTGGLTYEFDPTVGTFQRASRSFGPLFGDRALTIGRRKLSAGFNYQRTSYDTFEGQDLEDGSIKFYLRHQDCCTGSTTPTSPEMFFQPNGTRLSPPFEGDVIEAALSLKATTHTAALFANYGLTSHWDLGLAVPFVRVDLDARVQARIVRLVTGVFEDLAARGQLPPNVTPEQRRSTLNTHTFEQDNPNATRTVQRFGHATGLGDVVLRTKYHFLRRGDGGLAAGVDLRLPTGDANELLGAGGVQAKFLLIASSERGRLGQHVNIGYTIAQGKIGAGFAGLAAPALPDEFNYTGGVDFVVNPRFTVMGDLVGRTLRGAGRLDLVSKPFEFNDPRPAPLGPGCAGFPGLACATAYFDEFAPRSADLRLLLGTAGVKFNPTGNLLVSASVLFPFTNAGLRSRLTTIIGMDYIVK